MARFQPFRLNPQLQRSLVPWLVPLALVVVWQLLASRGVIPTRILPAPSAIALAAVELARSGELWGHLSVSAGRAGVGFLIGASLGLLFGLINGLLPRAELLLDSSFQMLRNVPPWR